MIRKLYLSHSDDPFENLSIENQFLNTISNNEEILFLYSNRPCIVMGRFQNIYEECNLSLMVSSEVQLVRRQSGGGCVYHDLGNLNFSFIHHGRDHKKESNHELILKALSSFGINAYASGRSDLVIDREKLTKKFSGSAFKQKKSCSFHHGTLLFNTDLDKLNAYLKPKSYHVHSKSIKSVRSSVINLSELGSINKDDFIDILSSLYLSNQKMKSPLQTTSHDVDHDYYKLITSDQWIIGENPKTKLNLEEKDLDVEVNLVKGRIDSLEPNSQTLNIIELNHICDFFKGCLISEDSLRAKYEAYKLDFSGESLEAKTLFELLMSISIQKFFLKLKKEG